MGRMLFFILWLWATTAGEAVASRHRAIADGGDPQIAAAQEVLQRALIYSGEITGELDKQTTLALRHFQMLRGLPVTGAMDAETVAHLHLPARDLIEEDRRFLENAPLLPPDEPPPLPAARPASATPSPQQTAPDAPREIRPRTVQNFLNFYFKAASYRKAKPELTYFAESVDYYDLGPLNREQLEEELSRSRLSRSSRFSLASVDAVTPLEHPGRVSIRFTVRITPLSRQGRPRASTNVETREAILERAPEGTLRFTSIRKTESVPRLPDVPPAERLPEPNGPSGGRTTL